MNRVLRFIASAVAVGSLAMLGWHSFHPAPNPESPVTDATLWTAGTAASAPRAGTHAAFPDATVAPAGAKRIPDAAFLRRAFPALKRVAIEGDGIDATSAAALAGLDVTWRRPAVFKGPPRLVGVSAPRTLTVGQRLTVQGRVDGLESDETITVRLEGPDAATQSIEIRASPGGEATFSLTGSAAAVAPGAFEWKLRLGTKGEPLVLGAVVAPPELPRVLIVQASPNVEGARLQRWLAESGARVTSRTRVSAGHVRFTTAHASPADFPSIDDAVLTNFDVVIAAETALRELGAGERAAIDAAIRNHGVGLLVIGEAGRGTIESQFTPWQLRAVDEGDGRDGQRTARLRLHNGTELAEPISVLPAEIVMPPAGRWLVRDTRDRILGVAVPRGRGWMARSLVTDTWRWLQNGHPEIFATYWSGVLSAIARPASTSSGRWVLQNKSGPIFAGEPVRLWWLGEPGAVLPAAEARRMDDLNAAPIKLSLARDVSEPSRAETLCWPERSGWHEVRVPPAGATMAFYVQPASALPALRSERRHDATARLAQGVSSLKGGSHEERGFHHTFVSYAWLALFVVSTGLLWLEQRKQ